MRIMHMSCNGIVVNMYWYGEICIVASPDAIFQSCFSVKNGTILLLIVFKIRSCWQPPLVPSVSIFPITPRSSRKSLSRHVRIQTISTVLPSAIDLTRESSRMACAAAAKCGCPMFGAGGKHFRNTDRRARSDGRMYRRAGRRVASVSLRQCGVSDNGRRTGRGRHAHARRVPAFD